MFTIALIDNVSALLGPSSGISVQHMQYVSETGQPLHRRIDNHRFDILHRRTEEFPVAKHFNSHGHSQVEMAVVAIAHIQSCDPYLRKIRESRWLRALGTSCPSGMNFKVDSL